MKSITADWKECIVQYEKMQENDLPRKVREMYVVSGVSFAEAEENISEEMQGFVRGEFDVININPAVYKEVFFSDDASADKWFKARVQFITIDDKSAKEKRATYYYLIQANTFGEAKKNLEEVMKGSIMDYEIVKIEEANIIDVFIKND